MKKKKAYIDPDTAFGVWEEKVRTVYRSMGLNFEV
jgi:hypothetical protein